MLSDASDSLSILRTMYGATLVGTLVGVFLSGIVSAQVYMYTRVYSNDRIGVKCMVALVWVMDLLHTCLICVASWMDLVERFGDWDLDRITWSVGASVALTALVTFLVHCFLIYRIYMISNGNLYLTAPLAVLAFFRLVAATISTSEMIRLSSYQGFVHQYGYVFTMGLGSAVALDIVITAAMCFYLRRSKSRFSTMNDVIDTLMLYTVETGMITCVTTIASLACWVTMRKNLIFLGLHFTISKLYANSFLAILNSRVTLGAGRCTSGAADKRLPIMLSDLSKASSSTKWQRTGSSANKALEINVETTVDISPDETRSPRVRREAWDEDICHLEELKDVSVTFGRANAIP
ncbi:uncharacterized protein PHACADRAFT_214190 [Phanerochaete carnosa HHB-10118-sp]|uniref:DUF6534 domain-containing protein n=1 Tax=Phanerochaete carnosa (strain HHB-10118-sp) TaxID=650164 RepID=K5UJB8_PHACS|nr:uncharacterized protein PHACADRAFT_214190 [Phanerochaete carnosa HHB-10118-sp]EKM49661.1 hypothetical protein PHACADRAFT_214190 [Phanerochaete carnosa HHB-10118-sp]